MDRLSDFAIGVAVEVFDRFGVPLAQTGVVALATPEPEPATPARVVLSLDQRSQARAREVVEVRPFYPGVNPYDRPLGFMTVPSYTRRNSDRVELVEVETAPVQRIQRARLAQARRVLSQGA